VQPVLNGSCIEQGPVFNGKLSQAGNISLSSNAFIKRNLPEKKK
jgi:hypothetical protein